MKEACSKSLDGEEVTAKDPMNKMKKIKETIVADGKRFGEKRAESGVGANGTLHRDYYWSDGNVVDAVGGHVTTATKDPFLTKDGYKGITAECVDKLGTQN
eukprot:3819053-Ditylum_brightwellii.AAC.1